LKKLSTTDVDKIDGCPYY